MTSARGQGYLLATSAIQQFAPERTKASIATEEWPLKCKCNHAIMATSLVLEHRRYTRLQN